MANGAQWLSDISVYSKPRLYYGNGCKTIDLHLLLFWPAVSCSSTSNISQALFIAPQYHRHQHLSTSHLFVVKIKETPTSRPLRSVTSDGGQRLESILYIEHKASIPEYILMAFSNTMNSLKEPMPRVLGSGQRRTRKAGRNDPHHPRDPSPPIRS